MPPTDKLQKDADRYAQEILNMPYPKSPDNSYSEIIYYALCRYRSEQKRNDKADIERYFIRGKCASKTAKITYMWGAWESHIVHNRLECRDDTDRSAYDALINSNEMIVQMGKVSVERIAEEGKVT